MLGLSFAAPLTAQNELRLQITDGVSPLTQNLNPQNGWVALWMECLPAYQGGWYGVVPYAYKPGTTGLWEYDPTPLDDHTLSYSYGNQTTTGLLVDCEPQALSDFFTRSLRDHTGAHAENAVFRALDPIFEPAANFDPNGPSYQFFGWSPYTPWERDQDNAFNISSFAEEAVWHRVRHTLPSQDQAAREAYFSGEDYHLLWQQGFTVALSLIGVRGINVTGGDPFGYPSTGLSGYPGQAPVFRVSAPALISYGGTGSANLFFFFSGTSTPVRPVHTAAPGGVFVHPACNWQRGMQIRLHQNTQGGAVYICDLDWADFGKVKITVPANASSGMHSIRKFRYYVGESGGQPVYGPWFDIQPSHRPLIGVQ
ncbi:MAG: hypothetical protein ACE37K_19750 [Planctomycetota bacterium]